MKDAKEYYCKVGPLVIKLHSINAVSTQIVKDLEATKTPNKEQVDIEIFINGNNIHSNYVPKIFSAKGSMNFNKQEFFVGYLNEIDYTVKNLFGTNGIGVLINNDKTNIKKTLKRIYKGKNTLEKDLILSYSLFWYVVHLSLLKKNCSFIHSGVFESAKGATIITGTGGCGKTSTLFKILEDEQYSYLSEDFGIIDNMGHTYYNPKPVSVYATDMEFGQSILKNHFSNFALKDKLLWYFKRKMLRLNPMVKIPPKRLMNNRVGKKTKIKNVLYFVRNNDEVISMSDVSSEELSERVLDASMRELKTLNELLLLMRANAPIGYKIPSFEDVRNETKMVYNKVFHQSERKIIFIPLKTSPDELLKYLKENGLI
ncbi:hypothetical protein WIW50_06245 [Flavobacteriaceae bacterium 3-367]|uniref:hypothetical protein n=1 Tax=Eudoraea algarum TaxID=3417568 RepID=UPI0032805379